MQFKIISIKENDRLVPEGKTSKEILESSR